MLKKFFISMLGSMAAFWLSIIILFFGSFIVIGLLIGKAAINSSATKTVTGDKILYLDLSGSFSDRTVAPSLIDIVQGGEFNTDDLSTILASIQIAKADKDVKGVYIDCGGSAMGIASRAEIIEALADFKKTGKFVWAYADICEQGDYYIASVADKIGLNPVGSINIHGLSSNVLFFKDLLDKIGVTVDVVRVGSFKSAVEPFMRMDMSEENRMQTSLYLNQIWDDMTKTMAENRGIKSADFNLMADSISFTWAPERYIDMKVVTELEYRTKFEENLKIKVDPKATDDDELPLVTPTEYLAEKSGKLGKENKPHIAVLFAEGDIVDDSETPGGIVATRLVPEIQRLANDKNVKALVLRVNSGGGSAFASEQIWKALEDFKAKNKPFYVSMGDVAASGGYYISCGADKIYCDAGTMTGSIGIFGIIPNASKLIKDKIGIGVETVETNQNATLFSIFNETPQVQLDAMQNYVNRGYETFTGRVAEGRKISQDSVKAIGGGRVWDGMSALKIGLVDQIGSLRVTIDDIAKKTGLENTAYIYYPANEDNFLAMLLSSGAFSQSAKASQSQEVFKAYRLLKMIKNLSPLQARMDMIIIE